jgi:sugar lactone lactonase YvrE
MDGATLQTLVHGPDHGISQPSGLALHGDFVYVSDFATGTISAFNKDGLLMDWLETGRPQSLGGIEFDAEGNLYIADTGANEILRISPL